ncbi:hypothetical protein AX16_003305 [Volvariella volvacea WC 439]|nr:hypothetical protein AX16_003305 [Volvariella volvacea WC 439]
MTGRDLSLLSNIVEGLTESKCDLLLATVDVCLRGRTVEDEDSGLGDPPFRYLEDTRLASLGVREAFDLNGIEVEADKLRLEEDGLTDMQALVKRLIEFSLATGKMFGLSDLDMFGIHSTRYSWTAIILIPFDNLSKFGVGSVRLTQSIPKLLHANPAKATNEERALYAQVCNEPFFRYGGRHWAEMADVLASWKNLDKWCAVVQRALGSKLEPGQIAKGINVFGVTKTLPV